MRAMVTASDWLPPGHVELHVLLADREADLTDGTAFENQHRASDGLHRLPE
jgi:hypothetical protein